MPDIIKTIGSVGDFPTIQAWSDDISSNAGGFYSDGDRAIAEVLENQTGTGKILNFVGAAASPGKIAAAIVRPTAGSESGGIPGQGIKLSSSTGTTQIVDVNGDVDYDVVLEDLEIESTVNSGSWNNVVGLQYESRSPYTGIIRRCLLHSLGHAGSSGANTAGINYTFGILRVIRCQIAGWQNATTNVGWGIRVQLADAGGLISNCGIDRGLIYGINESSGAVEIKNTIMLGSGTDFSGTAAAGSTKNMSSDATAPGTVTYHNQVRGDIWTDPDNKDWTLKPGTNAIGNGDNLGSTYEENIDITGKVVNGDWDLGAYQSEIQLPPGVPVSGPRRLHMIGF